MGKKIPIINDNAALQRYIEHKYPDGLLIDKERWEFVTMQFPCGEIIRFVTNANKDHGDGEYFPIKYSGRDTYIHLFRKDKSWVSHPNEVCHDYYSLKSSLLNEGEDYNMSECPNDYCYDIVRISLRNDTEIKRGVWCKAGEYTLRVYVRSNNDNGYNDMSDFLYEKD